MTPEAATATRAELDAMLEAKRELGEARAYLSTEEALEASPVPVSEQKLLGYPEWVCPRIRKDPSKESSPRLWDPRDIAALPMVLSRWQRARSEGREEEFKERRLHEFAEREQRALARSYGGSR